jgi:predicted DNA-binding transcriptional regulator YafY
MTDQTRRATRLIRVQQLLQQHGAMSVADLASHLNYSRRTVQRDLGALQSELGVPLVNVGRRWRIMEGSQHPLSPVHLTLQESRVIFLAMQAYATATDERDDNAISALEKLGDTLPEPLQADVRRTMEMMRARPEAEVYNIILRFVTRAWAESARLHIWYRSASSDHVQETDLDPYLLRPGANGGANYDEGWRSRHDMPRVFKIDRIVNAELTQEHFEPRNLDEIVERLGRSWGGVVFGDEQYDVTVDFTPQAASRVRETTWHVSQRLEELPDGGVRLRFVLPSLLEFVPWVLGWGAGATVVGPAELREQIAVTLHAAASNYPQPA